MIVFDGIYDTLKQTAKISQSAGGIGFLFTMLNNRFFYIRGTNGTSNGIVPMLRVFNDTARYVEIKVEENVKEVSLFI